MYSILLVDDEPRTIEALRRNIDWEACKVKNIYKAMSMDSALKIIKEELVDIMICDIEMPNGTGLQLLQTLRMQGKEIPCIFVTCHPEFTYMRQAIQLKCYDYILKPINYEEFTRVLKGLIKLLDQSREREEDTPEKANPMILERIYEKGKNEQDRNVEMEVKKYVKEHMVDNITVTDIARELHFNPQYLMRMFKAKTDRSIMEYITEVRIATAQQILKDTNLPIKEIANMVGYADYAYFTRVFRKETGESPSQYRSSR